MLVSVAMDAGGETRTGSLLGCAGFIAFFVGGIAVIAAAITLVFQPNPGAESSSGVAVVGNSCTSNADGSVHVQGKLRNDGGSDEIAIVEFSLTLFGGETETTQPFGGYNVPGRQTSLVGEDINVPPGASWVDCAVEIKG